VTCQPDTVRWENFGICKREVASRLCLGILGIFTACIVWITCFYFPYAYYVTSFTLALGEQPGKVSRLTFTTLVVLGNQIMYLLCAAVADRAGFRFRETIEMTYMVLYMGACFVNVIFDMFVTYFTTYNILVGLQVRTYDGRMLEHLSHMELFESYPMQKALGSQLFWYAFPSCFLVPFVLEPLLTISLPTHISELLVRSHPDIVGFAAERALQYHSKMDFGRYSDVSLNMSVAALILLFPGGFILPTFGVLAASHIYIYCMDHYRVLRAVPGFKLASDVVDRCACAMMAIPLGIVAAALVYKARTLWRYEQREVDDKKWFTAMAAGFLAHVLVHWLILFLVVPHLKRRRKPTEKSFPQAARCLPCSWFTANPVHCLRSRYLFEHFPPCCYYILGKEHLMKPNPSIGVYFQDKSPFGAKAESPMRLNVIGAEWVNPAWTSGERQVSSRRASFAVPEAPPRRASFAEPETSSRRASLAPQVSAAAAAAAAAAVSELTVSLDGGESGLPSESEDGGHQVPTYGTEEVSSFGGPSPLYGTEES